MLSPIRENSLVILLGAHEFPHAPRIPASNAFSACHDAIRDYFLSWDGFGLGDSENLLDLFDSSLNNTEMNSRIVKWLQERIEAAKEQQKPITDVFVYYTGHGGLKEGSKDYYLAIRSTNQDEEPYWSSLPIERLASTLRNQARFLRRYLILDACFAAAALPVLQTGDLDQVIEKRVTTLNWSDDENPSKGTVLLCASSAIDPAKIAGTYTMFSGALIKVLTSGFASSREYMTFREVQGLTATLIRREFGDEGVHPEIHSPDQRGAGDIANLDIFPNKARKSRLEVLAPTSAISVGGVVRFNFIPHATTWIGSDEGYPHERPRHHVSLSSFFLQDTPVTNQQFEMFCSATGYKTAAEHGAPALCWINNEATLITGADWRHPSGENSSIIDKDDHPVVQVNWSDAMAYCQWLSQTTGFQISLPTEVQWEYAASSSDGLQWPFGNTYEFGNANIKGQDTTPVRQFSPTSFDLYDMAGNVYQWCADWYAPNWLKAGHNILDEPTLDPRGPTTAQYKVLRGGSWLDVAQDCRCANRFQARPEYVAVNWGFRCCLLLTENLLEILQLDHNWKLPAVAMLRGDQ